jgi:hypothetical protein
MTLKDSISEALRHYGGGDWQSEDPLQKDHVHHCAAANEGQACCLDPQHELFDNLCEHIARYVTGVGRSE